MRTWIIYLFLYSHHTWCFEKCSFGLQKASKNKFSFEAFFMYETFRSRFERIDSSSSWWTCSKKNPQTKCNYTIYHFLRIKMVRKYGQKRDFAKFHSKLKHKILNIYKNGLGRVERTLWTSSGCNMEVWRPKTKNPPPFYLSHDFERFLSDFFAKMSI